MTAAKENVTTSCPTGDGADYHHFSGHCLSYLALIAMVLAKNQLVPPHVLADLGASSNRFPASSLTQSSVQMISPTATVWYSYARGVALKTILNREDN